MSPSPAVFAGATLAFGLVTIPVKLYRATHPRSPSFHLVHRECGTRVRQQFYCPTHRRMVERNELDRAFEITKD